MLKYEKGRTLVAAHRGVSGANIPCNTKTAFNIALMQGADIIELDVTKSLDGELFVFHPGMEKPHLGSDKFLKDMTAAEIKELQFLNQDDVNSGSGVSTLSEIFGFLKNKAYINVDKFWMHMEEITHCIKKSGVEDQVIIKIQNDKEQLDAVEKIAPDLPVMPVIGGVDTLTEYALEKDIKYLGAEVIFSSDNDKIVSDEYINNMHKRGLMIFGNAIVYDINANISAGHTDDAALAGNPEHGWGWFVKKEFDIIQTDWCIMLKNYINSL